MIKRKIEKEIIQISKEFYIVGILGPRQSGKTTLAKNLFPDYDYVSLETPSVKEFAQSDPTGFFNSYPSRVIFDEIQRVPELFSYIQTHVDIYKEDAKFVITGSHNYLMMEKISQSLSGRIGITTLLPLSIEELHNNKIEFSSLNTQILKGGYPRLYEKEIRKNPFFQNYIQTYIERDVRLIKNITKYNEFILFLKLLAGRSGKILNVAAVAELCSTSQKTINEWLSILETSYVCFRVYPYHKNYNKRLVKRPKIYFWDTGLLCHLLSIEMEDQLDQHPNKGAIFENFVIQELYKAHTNIGEKPTFYFWENNHEKGIDLIIEKGLVTLGIEIKAGQTLNKQLFEQLKYWQKLSNAESKNCRVIYAGNESGNRYEMSAFSWKKLKIPTQILSI